MVDRYLEMVDLVQPKFLVLENVTGFTAGFVESATDGKVVRGISPSESLIARLEERGFVVSSQLINCADWGIPQRRHRFIAIGVKREVFRKDAPVDVMRVLRGLREVFLASKGLPSDRAIGAREAIGDLETAGAARIPDPEHPRFDRIQYIEQENPTGYVKLMRAGCEVAPCSLRLPQHRDQTVARFRDVLATCLPGKTLSHADRARFKSKKHAFTPLAAGEPAPTVTTLPDDMIHYGEPRILTVREMARLQSFPDSYIFKGKYTTGGVRRKLDCPRYTQVGNAVPPLLGEALGIALRAVIALSRTDAGQERLADLALAVP
jgi:DNA (cytosine-5)-methyltransferase 1